MNSLPTGSLVAPGEGCAAASDSLEGIASAALVLAVVALRMMFGVPLVTGTVLMGRLRVKLVAVNGMGT